jgi:hypothetical protein
MWNQILIEAISEFTYKNPGALDKLQSITPDEAWSGPHADIYRDAAMVIVEPEAYLGRSDINLEDYHNMCDNSMDFIKGAIGCVDDSDKWNKVIDLVSETGY